MNNHSKEIQRLKSLFSYKILDTAPEKYFDDLAKLVSVICETPIALISFIDDKRQWYKAKIGIEANEVPIEETICQYTIKQEGILEIKDTLDDKRLNNNPNVHTENGVRYYAGVSLKSEEGYPIGTVCAVDLQPKYLSDEKLNTLNIIANQVMLYLNALNKNKDLSSELKDILEEKIKQTQNELKASNRTYNNLFNAIEKSNAIAEYTTDGTIIYVNKHFEKLTGYSKNELLGLHHYDLVFDNEKVNNKAFWEDLKSGHFQSGRFKRKHKSGKEIWIQASYSPVNDSNGKITKVTKIAQDISSEVLYKAELELAKNAAEELNLQKDKFIANMSHEIRTPIHAIIGFTNLLLEKEEDPEKAKKLNSVKIASDSLLHLINDILDLSKIESGILQLDREDFRIREIISNVFSMLQLKAEARKNDFNYLVSDEIPEILKGDKNRLIQVLVNLLGNAIKFTEKGKVQLFVDLLEMKDNISSLSFKIQDTGIGIPQKKLETIFDRFTQAEDDTNKNYGGTGLGLNISKLLIEKQGGFIKVQSEPGKGTVFSFQLNYENGIDTLKYAIQEINHTNASSQGRILMCEDNEMNQFLAYSIFNDSGYILDIAENGIVATELLKKNKYDLVLMDIQMPEMDGYQTTVYIRGNLKSEVPIIALTAHSMINEKNKCLSLGMNDYLTKPFKKEELFQKINFWIERSKNDLPVFSINKLIELSGGNEKFQLDMLNLFLKQGVGELEKIDLKLAEKKYEEAANLVHKLKSSFGLIDADTQILERIERNLLRGTNINDTPNDLKLLLNQLERINAEIEAYINVKLNESSAD